MYQSTLKWFTSPKHYFLCTLAQICASLLLICMPLSGTIQDRAESIVLQDARIYENVEVRQLLRDTIFAKVFPDISTPQGFYPQRSSGMSVGFSIKKIDPFYYLIFANNTSHQHPGEDTITYYTRGSYIVKKSFETHKIAQILVLLQSNPDCYIRIVPNGKYRSSLNVVIFGNSFYQDITVPMSIETIAVSPLSKLMMVTRYQIDWTTVFHPDAYEKWKNMEIVLDKIFPRLRFIRESLDGAQDKFGNLVLIKTFEPQPPGTWGFNCSGFVKWIVDGFFQYLSSERQLIPLNLLKQKSVRQVRNPWNEQFEESRDPNFGIDWIRNLAYIMETAINPLLSVSLTDQDVQSVSLSNFYPERGYSTQDVKSILYELAIKYPGNFFLGSISTPFGRNPILWQHRHVVAFFPYFTNKGTFVVSVLDTGRERSVDYLIKKYPDSFTYFVKVLTLKKFFPPQIPRYSAQTSKIPLKVAHVEHVKE